METSRTPLGSFYFVGDPQLPQLPPPNPRCLRPECEFAIGLPEMKWRQSRIRGVQGGPGRVLCEIPIGKDDTGRSAVWVLHREWLYRRKMTRNLDQKYAKTSGKLKILPVWLPIKIETPI